MPDEDKTFSASLVLNLTIWWRHVHTLFTSVRNIWTDVILQRVNQTWLYIKPNNIHEKNYSIPIGWEQCSSSVTSVQKV